MYDSPPVASSRMPDSSRTTSSGIRNQRWREAKWRRMRPTVRRRWPSRRAKPGRRAGGAGGIIGALPSPATAGDQQVLEHEGVDRMRREEAERVDLVRDDRLTHTVERRVERDLQAGRIIERAEHGGERGRGGIAHGLHARGAIDVADGGEALGVRGQDRADGGHEWRQIRRRGPEVVRGAVGEDGGRERAERLAALDRPVEALAAVERRGVCEDRALAERARAPLEAALAERDDLA